MRKCAQCGNKFTPPKSHIKCCSPECSKARKRELDRTRSKAKAEVKVEKKAKKTSKTVAKEVVKLPPKPAVKVKVVKIKKQKPTEVLIHKDDIVRFVDFSPERVMKFGMRLVKMALDHIHELEAKGSCDCGKCAKKPTKKIAKKK